MTKTNAKPEGRLSRLQVVKNRIAAGETDDDLIVEGEHRVLDLSQIELDPDQPQKNIGDIVELAASIKGHGLLFPIIVRPTGRRRFMVVAGERRYRAHRKAGLKTIDVIIRQPDDQSRIELQLVENLHRKDLDAFEEASGYARLKTNHRYTDAQIAKKVSKGRSRITEMLSITRIPADIRKKCLSSDIPLSRDTLYLIARQPNREKMLSVLRDAQDGIPYQERRQRGRTGRPREATASKKPKWTHTSTIAKATVIVQSHNSTLTDSRRLQALKDTLNQIQSD